MNEEELKQWKKKVDIFSSYDLEHMQEVDMKLLEEFRKIQPPQVEEMTQRFRLAIYTWANEYIQEFIQSSKEEIGDMKLTPEQEIFVNIQSAFSEGFTMGIIFGRKSKEKLFRDNKVV